MKRISVDARGGNDSIVDQGSGAADALPITLSDGDGDDTLKSNAIDVLFSGGAGTGDVVDYTARTANLVVWLDGSRTSGQRGDRHRFDGTVERVWGGGGNDYIVGTKGNNALCGNGGNDTLYGGGGDGVDACFGGAGNDYIYVVDGNADYVDGGPGVDRADVDLLDTVVNTESVTRH